MSKPMGADSGRLRGRCGRHAADRRPPRRRARRRGRRHAAVRLRPRHGRPRRIARFRAAFPRCRPALCHKSKLLCAAAQPYREAGRRPRHRLGGRAAASRSRPAPTPATSASPAPASATPSSRRRSRPGVTLNCESEGEAERALAIGARLGRTPRLAVRVNPDFEIKGSGMRMGGGAKPFGVDAARVPALVRRILDAGAEWRGFHIFAGSQALDADALIEAQARDPRSGRASSPKRPARAPPLVNLGGGFGIPYFHGEQPLDVEKVGAALGDGPGGTARRSSRDTRLRDRARPLAGRRGGRLSDPDRRPQGQPRQDLPGHRRRHAPPARRLGQFRPGGPPQLSGCDRQPLRRRGRGGGRASSAACARRSTGSPTTS